MNVVRALRHPVETIRTVPVYVAGVACEVSLAAFSEALLGRGMPPLGMAVLSVVALTDVGVAARCAVAAIQGLERRDRLEAVLERRGEWNEGTERIFQCTTEAYCARQLATVACENMGFADEYRRFCSENSEGANFAWLPQV